MMHFFIFLFSFLSCAAYDMHGCALHTYEWCVCLIISFSTTSQYGWRVKQKQEMHPQVNHFLPYNLCLSNMFYLVRSVHMIRNAIILNVWRKKTTTHEHRGNQREQNVKVPFHSGLALYIL